jgi:cytidylate kinase
MATQIVAIDGPAGSGKSSVSKQVARELGFGYLDTGAAYRALAWAVQNLAGFELEKLEQLDLDSDFDYSISTDPNNYWVRVGQTDVTEAIRSAEVATFVSQVARLAKVREYMKRLTHRIVEQANAPGVVVEGRDITTVVAPDAKTRILLTASEEVRLIRRSAELSVEAAETLKRQVTERDASDSKVVEFMTPAAGVELVDTSDLNFEQSVAAVLKLIER